MESKKINILAGGITHELFRGAYEAFIEAGATMIMTNNYYVSPGIGFNSDEIREYSRLAGELAAEARTKSGKDSVQICGSLPPLMPGYRSDRIINRQQGHDTYLLIGEALLPFVDMFVAETMSSLEEAKLAFEAAQMLQKPVMVSFALNSTGQLRSGEPVAESVQEFIEFCTKCDKLLPGEVETKTSPLCGILFNCSQPEDIAKALMQIKETPELLNEMQKKKIHLGGYGDHISPVSKAGAMEESMIPRELQSAMDMEVYSKFAMRWIDDGADIVGGCCEIPPDYLQHICETLSL
ncbi:hypothetical protein BBO99_00008514 [Phytophthora kernoviae]|uniref:Hcy-binding domain-containing protein n=2 Tax=Phytophthora kernoviae TaxID=325452 RepID=A0A421EW66_9STRA|nr:hypothetical protein G195_009816 [Phytophthora kernoviae 00238/432]KAG2511587.1 hypothetical protein JM16_007925 [Phytophthora kernoviae]KAG2514680.1 hypothetical protein JM18_007927 [Phytophthora kernoviae]RLN05953.1 hypothetical protein BBI17_008520 [Phytophthora kernoviae]RLN75177.1 hypothetical protein BBO99_00008514 [Phytophthora kernoviae]